MAAGLTAPAQAPQTAAQTGPGSGDNLWHVYCCDPDGPAFCGYTGHQSKVPPDTPACAMCTDEAITWARHLRDVYGLSNYAEPPYPEHHPSCPHHPQKEAP